MSRSSSPTISHRVEYFVFRSFEGCLRLLSLETTFKLGELIGRIAHRFCKSRRHQVERNLRFAFGAEKSREEITALIPLVFERSGANFLTSLRIPFCKDDEILSHLAFDGLEEMISESEKGGIILVTAHMGNWELLAQALFLTPSEFRVGTHYRPLNNQLINAVIERRRKRRGLQLFPKSASTHRLAGFLKEGGVLGILADQRVGSRGAAGVFFGRPTTCSPLPHLLAKRAKARLVRLHCETVGIAKWKVCFAKIEEKSAQACASNLEQAWRCSPADVFWFEDRWRIQGRDPLKFLNKYPTEKSIQRPLRLVNFSKGEGELKFSSDLLSQEVIDLNLQLDDEALSKELVRIEYQSDTPPDVFVAPEETQKRLRRLSGKTLVICS